jgi:hypothetical protein
VSLQKVQTASSSNKNLDPPLNFSADCVIRLPTLNSLTSLETPKAVLPNQTMPLIRNAPNTITISSNPFSAVQNAKAALKKSMLTFPPTLSSNAWPQTTSTTIQPAPFTKRTLSTVNSVHPHP